MTHDSTNFNLSLEPDYDEFDPLEDFEDEAEEGQADEFLATVSPAEDALAREAAEAPAAPAADERPAEERTADLLKAMAPRRKVLLGILAYCDAPQPVADVNAHVDELQENNFSVYTAANLCTLLERAGALARVTPDGEPAEDIEVEPEVVVVDGVEYLEAREPVQICWVATEAGRDALEADKPLERLRALLEEDAAYQVIYKRILTLCAAEGGAKTPDINAAVDDDPLVQKPRFYAPHFIDKLEKCDALAWKKAWIITEIGQAGLDMLADVADEPAADADAGTATPESPAEKE
ncbi:hypothetical protein [Arabiibacter massiliensis]|uniref:hypothetical protein n=1 Tax=Arabiibacter massiliensis TaxID=1870985 RepID=UPI0009BA58F3|nr:hypothetical protein [Arabiibacter massiliensis]